MIHEHDAVALIVDRPKDNLRRGDVGAVVHIYKGGETFEVEFFDERGRTKCVSTVQASELMRLNVLPLSA